MKDYSMDKRGDVGSWSRIAAMEGLKKVALSAQQADLNSEGTGAEETGGGGVGSFVTVVMVTQMVSTILKQLCEKLDNVRSKAGSVMESLLDESCPLSKLIPNRDELHKILSSNDGIPVNWGLASETFPKMVKVMELSEYHDAVVSGLILSVGGLTEAVVKSSSKSLLEWSREKKMNKDFNPLNKLSCVLLSLFEINQSEDRVILPLMKTVELLLEGEVFDFLCLNDNQSAANKNDDNSQTPPPPSSIVFGENLLNKVKKELYRSTNVVKLFTGLNIGLSLLRFPELRKTSMQLVLELLGHRYPRVRKHSAEQFYTKLFIDERLVDPEVYDLVLDLLRCTVWDADVQSARQERDQIAAAVGVQMAEYVSAPKKAKAKAKDELDSYQHLVNEVGY
jgi:hypothetical protein